MVPFNVLASFYLPQQNLSSVPVFHGVAVVLSIILLYILYNDGKATVIFDSNKQRNRKISGQNKHSGKDQKHVMLNISIK